MQANLQQKDTTYTKIFVGGLPYHTTDETLRAFFSKFGDIDEAVVITDRSTGKSRGYGFVTMAHKEGADEAIKDPNPTIDGRRANVNLAYLGAKNRTAALPFSYSVLARMPTYPSTATAYPSNLIYYPLAQQSTLQQPVYLAPTTAGTGTTWSTNLLSPFNLPTNTNTTVTNTGTASPQTIYELSTGLFDTTSTSTNATGQPIYWPTYN